MLSIIISSYQPEYFAALEKNIAETCGIPYEIIKIDNPGIMGICEAYNKGAEKAKFDNLLFLHEDVEFQTNEWGKNLISHLIHNENVGLLGIAGGGYKSNFPSSWSNIDHLNRRFLIQCKKNGTQEFINQNPYNQLRSKVVCIDGVFIGVKKKVWLSYKFDQKMLKGFHGYDIDFSLSVAQEKENHVIFDILIKHFSEGNPDGRWMEAAMNISHKWKRRLPYSIHNLTPEEERKYFNFSYMIFNIKIKSLHIRKIKRMFYLIRFWPRIPSLKTIIYLWKNI